MHVPVRMSKFTRLSVLLLALILLIHRVTVHSDDLSLIAITADTASQIIPLASLPFMPEVRKITFSQTGNRVTAFSVQSQGVNDSTINARLWDLSTFTTINLPHEIPWALNSDGTRVLVGREVVDIPSGQSNTLTQSQFTKAAFSPDGEMLMTLDTLPGILQLWDVETGAEWAVLTYDSNTLPVFSPDSREIVLLTPDHTAQLWNIATQSVRLALPVYVNGVIYAAEGRHLITYGETGFDLWDTATGENLDHGNYQFEERGGGIAAELSPDESVLLIRTANYNHPVSVELWQISDPATVRPLALHDYDHDVFTAFSGDGRFLAIASDSVGGIDLFSTENGAQIAHLDEQIGRPYNSSETPMRYLAFNQVGDVLITGSADRQIRLWRRDGHDFSLITTLVGGGFYLTPDNTTLITLLGGRILFAYGIPIPERPQQPFVVPAHIIPSAINVRVTPDGNAAVIGQVRGNVLVSGRSGDYFAVPEAGGWVRSDPLYIELLDGFPVALLPELNPAAPIEVPPTVTPTLPYPTLTPIPTPLPTLAGDRAAPITAADFVVPSSAPPNGITAINAATAANVRLLGLLPSGAQFSQRFRLRLIVSPDGTQVIIPAFSRRVRYQSEHVPAQVWSLTDLQPLEVVQYSAVSPGGDLIAYQGWGNSVIHLWSAADGETREIHMTSDSASTHPGTLIFSPDGSRLISAGLNSPTLVWDTSTLAEQYLLAVTGTPFITPDSRIMLLSRYNVISGFDLETGSQIFRVEAPSYYEENIAFNPDSRHMAVANGGGLRVWTLDGTLLWQVQGSFVDAVFHPGRRMLATVEEGDVLRLWNADTGEMIATYPADADAGMAFSPDGSLLVIGNPLRFIDLQTGAITQSAVSYAVNDPLFSPDGGTLLINGLDSTMVFGVPTEQRPEWQPITGRILSSGVNVRALPSIDSAVIGYASGEVRIGGRALTDQAVYLLDAGGWVWSDGDYIDLGDHALSELPLIYTESVE